jgi:TolB-like protein
MRTTTVQIAAPWLTQCDVRRCPSRHKVRRFHKSQYAAGSWSQTQKVIARGLSRFRWLFVIARISSFTYKGKAVDVKQVGRELGVRYVLEGNVRKSANRVRIAGQLIDASSGIHLWADRFEGAVENVFDVQDQATANVVGAIAPRLQQAEIERARRKPTESLDAYDLFLHELSNSLQVDQRRV